MNHSANRPHSAHITTLPLTVLHMAVCREGRGVRVQMKKGKRTDGCLKDRGKGRMQGQEKVREEAQEERDEGLFRKCEEGCQETERGKTQRRKAFQRVQYPLASCRISLY